VFEVVIVSEAVGMVDGSNIQRIVLAYILLPHFMLLQIAALYGGYFAILHFMLVCVVIYNFCWDMFSLFMSVDFIVLHLIVVRWRNIFCSKM